MAYAPIAFTAPNYRDNANEWIKAYEPGTTTPKVMALESNGGTQVAKLQLNADGFIVSAGAALVIPYLSGAYDLWLFPTEAEADVNNTANAIRLADNIGMGFINDLSQAYIFDTVALFKASLIEFPDSKTIHINDRDADFTKITGIGTGNNRNILASTGVSQSIVLVPPIDKNVYATQMGIVADAADQTTVVQEICELTLASYGIGKTVVFEFGVLFDPALLDFKLFNNTWIESVEGNLANHRIIIPNGNDGTGMDMELEHRTGYNTVLGFPNINNNWDMDYGTVAPNVQVASYRCSLWGNRFNGAAGWQCATDLLALNDKHLGTISNTTNRMMVSYHPDGEQRIGQREFLDLSKPPVDNEICGQTFVASDDDAVTLFGLRQLEKGVDSDTAIVAQQKITRLELNGDLTVTNSANTKIISRMNDLGGLAVGAYIQPIPAAITIQDQGRIFTNPNGYTTRTLTPSIPGLQFEFRIIFTQFLIISPAAGQVFRDTATGAQTAAGKGYYSNTPGSFLRVVCVTSGGIWEVEKVGTWTNQA